MTRSHRFVAPRMAFLRIFVLALLVRTAESFFADTPLSCATNGKTENCDFGQEERKSLLPSTHAIVLLDENQSTPDQTQHTDDREGLVFEGEFKYQSDIVPIPTKATATDLFDFFSDPKNRDLVIKGGGNPCESIPLTPELQDEWTNQAKIVKSTPPKGGNNEEILAVYSEVPIVPGLSLRACSYTGCKTLKEPTSALPYYEFTLLKESYEPVGKKAMTWIFDKVVGKKNKTIGENRISSQTKHTTTTTTIASGKQNGGTEKEQVATEGNDATGRKTYALSRVMLKPFPQDGGCKICYYGHVRLTLSKRFLHILPLPTKVVQRKVNKSIRKQLEYECTRSIEKFRGALIRWNEKSANTSVGVP